MVDAVDAWWRTLPTRWICQHPYDQRVLLAEGWVVKCRHCRTCRFTTAGYGSGEPRWEHVHHRFPSSSGTGPFPPV